MSFEDHYIVHPCDNTYPDIPLKDALEEVLNWIEHAKDKETVQDQFQLFSQYILEIINDEEFTEEKYEDIRLILKKFNDVPLRLKRLFNVSVMNNYSMFIASRHFKSADDFAHLEIGIEKFSGNLSKFFYNPIPLDVVTREWFKNLKTLYIYNYKDNRFENDERIIARKIVTESYYNLTERQVSLLESWTFKEAGKVIFDSEIDDWKVNSSTFLQKINGKGMLTILVEDETGEKFGYYSGNYFLHNNKKEFNRMASFHFITKENDPSTVPLSFLATSSYYHKLEIGGNNDDILIEIGDLVLYKEEKKDESFCYLYDKDFFRDRNYSLKQKQSFIPKRIQVIQMNLSNDERTRSISLANQPFEGLVLHKNDIEEYKIRETNEMFKPSIAIQNGKRSLLVNPKVIPETEVRWVQENDYCLFIVLHAMINKPFGDFIHFKDKPTIPYHEFNSKEYIHRGVFIGENVPDTILGVPNLPNPIPAGPGMIIGDPNAVPFIPPANAFRIRVPANTQPFGAPIMVRYVGIRTDRQLPHINAASLDGQRPDQYSCIIREVDSTFSLGILSMSPARSVNNRNGEEGRIHLPIEGVTSIGEEMPAMLMRIRRQEPLPEIDGTQLPESTNGYLFILVKGNFGQLISGCVLLPNNQ